MTLPPPRFKTTARAVTSHVQRVFFPCCRADPHDPCRQRRLCPPALLWLQSAHKSSCCCRYSMSFPCSHPAEALGTTQGQWTRGLVGCPASPWFTDSLLQQGNGKMCGHLKLNRSSSAHVDMLKQKP